MKNLLVTGGCGFIGTNFIRYLFEESDFSGRIVNIDALTYAGNPGNLIDIEKTFSSRYVFVKGDICDKKFLKSVFNDYGVDAVCHFAAESHVDRSIDKPDAFIKTNIVGTYNLLELARANLDRISRFHHISTDEVFGSLPEKGFFTEQTPYRPNSPYSASKASSDHLVRAYHTTYGLPVTISNCSNNYGPYQFPEKLLPLMIINAYEGKPLPVYGDGKNIRDWLYIKDHCLAIWTIMKFGRRGDTYNIGGNSEIKNIDLVQMVCDMLDKTVQPLDSGPRRKLINFVKDRPGHDRRYAIDFSKLKNELGWTPLESLDSGLSKTIRWYLENQEWVKHVRSGEYREWILLHYGFK